MRPRGQAVIYGGHFIILSLKLVKIVSKKTFEMKWVSFLSMGNYKINLRTLRNTAYIS